MTKVPDPVLDQLAHAVELLKKSNVNQQIEGVQICRSFCLDNQQYIKILELYEKFKAKLIFENLFSISVHSSAISKAENIINYFNKSGVPMDHVAFILWTSARQRQIESEKQQILGIINKLAKAMNYIDAEVIQGFTLIQSTQFVLNAIKYFISTDRMKIDRNQLKLIWQNGVAEAFTQLMKTKFNLRKRDNLHQVDQVQVRAY
ncbi:MAG: hypothetical protein EZS28_034962 [Streblomastix strix]|uniref:Uncharacterized protein n=1 Tax=Streblomastix strix TaxID=222440 RepID=A0A5J4UHE8_9EUKA|nr:MAG: hypothetical protein EZS28_034962 [Streblomastix strix]